MPKMPDETALGIVSPQSPGVVGGPTDYVGPALQSLGGELQRMGAGAEAEAKRKKGEDDTLDLMRARADWNTRRLLEDDNYRLDKNPEYGKWEPAYQKNIKSHQSASASLIRDPQVREKFELETTDDITRGTLGVRDRSGKIDLDKKMQEALQGIDTNMRLAGAPGTSDKDRDIITNRVRADIDNAVAAGIMDPAKAIEVRQNFVKGISVFRVQKDIEDDPQAASGNLNRGTKGGPGSVIKGFEGFRTTPYADTGGPSGKEFSAWRVGYGSDTITRADGSVVKVKPGMKITRDDAERDLARRMAGYQEKIVATVGPDAWGKMSGNAKEALLSVAHNYGSLPDSVVSALRTGDAGAVANAVEGLSGHNSGVNADRRMKEAALIRNGGDTIAGAPDYYQFLDPDQRLRLQSSAEGEIGRREAVKKETNALAEYQMSNLLKDDVTQIEQTGKASDLDPAVVAGVMGDKDTAKWLDDRRDAAAAFTAVESIDGLKTDEIEQHVAELEPQPDSPDYDRQSKLYDKAVVRANKVIQERESDPAKSVAKAPMVKKAMENYDPENPQSVQGLVRARLAAQSGVGINGTLQNPVTRQEASDLFAPIVTALDRETAEMTLAKGSSTPAERRSSIKEIKARTTEEMKKAIDNIEGLYGPYAGQVLTQAIAQNFRNQNDANLMANVLRKLNAGEKVTNADISALDHAGEASQAEAALEPGGGGSWVPDWVTAPLKAYGPALVPPSAGIMRKMRTDADQFAKQEKDKAKVGPFPPVTQRAVEALKNDPSKAEDFDKMFGPGSAEKWLPKAPVEASQ